MKIHGDDGVGMEETSSSFKPEVTLSIVVRLRNTILWRICQIRGEQRISVCKIRRTEKVCSVPLSYSKSPCPEQVSLGSMPDWCMFCFYLGQTISSHPWLMKCRITLILGIKRWTLFLDCLFAALHVCHCLLMQWQSIWIQVQMASRRYNIALQF